MARSPCRPSTQDQLELPENLFSKRKIGKVDQQHVCLPRHDLTHYTLAGTGIKFDVISRLCPCQSLQTKTVYSRVLFCYQYFVARCFGYNIQRGLCVHRTYNLFIIIIGTYCQILLYDEPTYYTNVTNKISTKLGTKKVSTFGNQRTFTQQF